MNNCGKKLNNLEEMNKLLETHNLPELNQGDTENPTDE